MLTDKCEAFFCENGKVFLKLHDQPKPIAYKEPIFHASATQNYRPILSYGKNVCYDNGILFFIGQLKNLIFIDCNDPFPNLKGRPRDNMLPELHSVLDISDVELLCSRNRRVYVYCAPSILLLLRNQEESVTPLWRLDTQNDLTAMVPVRSFLVAAQLTVERPIFEVSLILLNASLELIYSIEISTSIMQGLSPSPISHLRHMSYSSVDILAMSQFTGSGTIIYIAALFNRRLYLLGSKIIHDALSARDMFVVAATGEVFLVGLELLVKFKIKL